MLQATDAIVDTAILLRKPFVVVPCCVFARDFLDRRTPDGERVVRYDQLLSYLQSKHPGIRTHDLNVEGKSRVLYLLPQDYDERTGD